MILRMEQQLFFVLFLFLFLSICVFVFDNFHFFFAIIEPLILT